MTTETRRLIHADVANTNGNRGGLPPKSLKKRKLIKGVVGKVRTSSYQLPEEGFIYGISNQMDVEGAGKVMQSWSQSEPSQPPASMQSFPATNRVALKNGCLDAKSQREFAKSFPVLKKNPKQSKAAEAEKTVNDHRVFGMKNKATDMPMTQLLKASSQMCALETDYPDLSHMKKKGRLPPAKQTKASQLLKDAVIGSSSKSKEEKGKFKAEWKMKRFVKGIESKVALRIKS